MELRQLRYFVRSAELLNFTKAASQCCITQSTLSQQIKLLEYELNVLLFERVGKRVFLTHEGEEFLKYARQTVADAEYSKQIIEDIKEVKTGTIKIGTTYGLSAYVTDLIDQYNQKYPLIHFKLLFLRQDELIDATKNRDVDFAITFNLMTKDETLKEILLATYHLSAIVSKDNPLANQEHVTLNQLRKYNIATPMSGMNARRMFDKMVAESGVDLRATLEINEIHTLLHLVRTGRWIAVLVDSIIIGENNLKAVPFKHSSLPMDVVLIYPKGMYMRKAIKEFLSML
jgi:LysR family cyn operon transcriptional activator